MIVKKVLAKSNETFSRISALLDYVTTAQTPEGDEKCLFSRGFNTFGQDLDRIKAEIMAQVESGKNGMPLERRIMQHWIISFKGIERPDLKDIEKAATKFLEEMGLGDHQAVMGVHVNTDNIHAHLAISRINPATHKACEELGDVIHGHAVLAGIEKMLGAEPERNALFTWNAYKGAVRNKRHRNVSRKFAYASPEVVMVTLPKGMERPEFPGMRAKNGCWHYEGVSDACAVWDENSNRIWFLNWNYRDTIDHILALKEKGATVTVQKELAWLFSGEGDAKEREKVKEFVAGSFQGTDEDVYTGETTIPVPWDPLVEARGRPPTLPVTVREMRHKRNARKYWQDVRMRYERRHVPEIRVRAVTAMHMRAHSFVRRDIEDCLTMDGMQREEARALVRWLYSAAGNTELFRLQRQGTLVMEQERSLKKMAPSRKRKAARMRLSTNGKLLVGDEKEKRLAPAEKPLPIRQRELFDIVPEPAIPRGRMQGRKESGNAQDRSSERMKGPGQT